MPFPNTIRGLEAAGYKSQGAPVACKGPTCQVQIQWWKTPNGKFMPLDADSLEPHWGTCSDRTRYQREAKRGR